MNERKICIVGLGYVGLPLLVAFGEKYKVIGYDTNELRIKELIGGTDSTLEVEDGLLASVSSNICFTSNIKDTLDCNIYIVTVPTPIDSKNLPDLNPLIEASQAIGKVLSLNDIVIYESTVYPGVTEEVCVPELEKSSEMKFNKDFFCGYSPERINPGDKERRITKILKVTSGSTTETAQYVDNLYKEIISAGTYLAPSIKVAEASKLIENTQRDVNIALINELAIILNEMKIDTSDVLDASATKWNFINLTPGLVGGHCIGIDPYYLTFKAKELGYQPNLILASRQINNGMSKYIADQTIKQMLKAGITIINSNMLILGYTFKEDCADIRNTKVLDIFLELKSFGVNIDVYDPYLDTNENIKHLDGCLIADPISNNIKYDAIIVAVAHKEFKKYTAKNYSQLSKDINVIIDVKNIVKNPTWRL